jgi:uncharacterized membrane protein YagU involved in acid resistance
VAGRDPRGGGFGFPPIPPRPAAPPPGHAPGGQAPPRRGRKADKADEFNRAVTSGAVAGLAGALLFGAAMLQVGVQPSMALLLVGGPTAGFAVHLAIGAVLGAGLGVIVHWQRPGAGETIFLGVAYGTLWWFLGPLTALPVILGAGPVWDLVSLQAQFPGLLGHLIYGVTAGTVLAVLREPGWARRGAARLGPRMLLRGALAGLAAAWLLGIAPERPGAGSLLPVIAVRDGRLPDLTVALFIGPALGIGFSLLYPRGAERSGPALIRGQAYGFILWIAGYLTILPLIQGGGLPWSLTQARLGFDALPGFLLLGALIGLFSQWLAVLGRLLLSDDTRVYDRGGGARGLDGLRRDVLAGFAGGGLFTLAMAQSGFLSTAARLVGSDALLTGFLVHLLVSSGIGVTYGLLFRRQSYNAVTALGWGMSYGFFWWIAGPLTLLPILLGGGAQWSADAAASAFTSLIGHLVFGAGLGLVFHRLESRLNPQSLADAGEQATAARQRREQALAAAPALWSVMMVIILTVPLVLGRPTP